ncbi:PHD finger protein 10 [Anthophora plagiata]
MSESPKMGLFGSKDETKETKKETKDDSPDRYAPYCIDSDSETYDTEALSIMDINDIIGVQSEPVSDSTLESEIAALSQMITESKTDTSQSGTEIKYKTSENELIKVNDVPTVENMDTTEVANASDRLTSTLEELEIVCSAEETTSGYMEQLSKGNLHFNNENTLQESLQLCEEQKDNDTRDNSEMNALTDSVVIVDTKDVENLDVPSQTDVEFVQSTSDSVSVTLDVVKSEENVNRPNINEEHDSNIKIATVNSEVTIVESENSIRGSLQLIGEAYSSEDSQDTIINEEEPKETNSTVSSNENSLIPCEEKKDPTEVCEPQQDVNNVSDEVNNISSDKICTEKDIAETIRNEEVYNTEVDSLNCSTEPKHTEELPINSQDAKDIVPNECKVDSPSNIALQCEEKEEDVNIADTVAKNVQEGLMEEKKIDVQVTVEETVTLEHSEMEVDEKDVEPTSDTCVVKAEECKVEVTEESTETERDKKTTEHMVVEEEISSKNGECIGEEKEATQESEEKDAIQESEESLNTLDAECNVASNDQVLSTESNDEVSADNDIKTREEKSEVEIGITELKIQSESIDNSTNVELDKLDSPQVTENLDVLKEVELPEEKAEMEVEKLESIEREVEQDFLKPTASQLSPEVINDEIPVVSKEDSVLLQDSTEQLSHSDNIIDTATNVGDNIEIKTEEENTLDSESSRIIEFKLKEDVTMESVDTAELFISQEKSEDELKTCTSESSDTISKCEAPMEVDLNKDSVSSALETSTTSNDTQPMDVTIEENSEDKADQPLEEVNDKETQEIEITNVQITEGEDCFPKEESQEASEIKSAIIEETESGELADVITKEIEISERYKDLEIKEKIEEEVTGEKQVTEENTVEREAEEETTIEKQTAEEEMTIEKQTAEEETTIEKQTAEEEMTIEKQTAEEEVTIEKQTAEEEVTIEKQTAQEEIIIEKQAAEEEVTIEKQTAEEEITIEKQTAQEEMIIEKQTAKEEMTIEKQTAEEEVTIEKQTAQEEMTVEKQTTEEKITIGKQTAEKEITIEKQTAEKEITIGKQTAEKEITIEKQTAEKEITIEKQTAEEVTIEKQTAEEEVTVEKQIEEQITAEKQTEEEITIEKQAEEEITIKKQAEESTIEEQTEENGEEGFSLKIVEEEQLKEINNEIRELENQENICNPLEENYPEQSEEDTMKNKLDIKIDEAMEYINEEELVSESKVIDKDPFSLSDHAEVIVSKEDAKEEYMEEEMSLTLEPEDIESQPEIVKSDLDEKSGNERDIEFSEEMIKEDQEDTVVKMDEDTLDLLGMEKSSAIDMDTEEPIKSADVEDSESNKIEELLDKQQLDDDDSKNDTNKDNLKNILETANNVEELFTEEQCQNTQDIVTSILDDVRSATDFKNILSTETNVANEIEEVFQQSGNLPLVEAEIEELAEKLPHDSEDILNKDMEDTMSTQNMDSLEGLLGLDLMPEGEDSTLKSAKSEEQLEKPEQLSKVVDMSLLLEQSNHESSDMGQDSDYITHVISSCLDESAVPLEDNVEKSDRIEDDKSKEVEASDILKVDEDLISGSMDKDDNIEDLQKDLREDTDLPENELDMDFEETPLESVDDLEETESKLELAQDILLQSVDQGENLNDPPSCVETSQPSSEISELESAVKFLQESEEQAMDSPLILSPKMVESVVDDISKQADAASLFVPDEDMCENASELDAELQNIAADSISISEAEIISEAAKLESEKKLAEQVKLTTSENKFEVNDEIPEEKITVPVTSEPECGVEALQHIEMQQTPSLECAKVPETEVTVVTLSQKVRKILECIPKVSLLEERLKEPPKIEIPTTDVAKVTMSPTTSKDSLLIQKDAKLIAYQKMLESPKLIDKTEPKIMETPRKDSEKHDFENVGSPRIILKIAKSAITDCGEPRSPKSPKIRSATNSPNPEDSPGQKLGKIKLKLSKSGHPSIISNENIEEVGQWYSEGSSSLSPIGMKIKLSKSGDASIVSSEKHDSIDDSKEGKHKFEEIKRTESPIGMKIKLSKSGDASIVQQDCKEMQMKHKDKLDIVQGSPKRTESPIGMKIKLLKTGDASIIQTERQDYSEEYKDNAQVKQKEKHEPSYDSPKRTDSPIGMKIKLSKTGDASIVSPDLPEDKEASKTKDKQESPPEVPKRTESPIGMKIKLTKTKGGASIISMENSEEPKDKLEVPDVPKRTESPLGMKIKLSKSGDASIVHSEMSDEYKEKVDMSQEAIKLSEAQSGMKIKMVKSGEISTIAQETMEEPAENVQEALSKVESPIGMKIKLSKFGDASIIPSDKQEQLEEGKPLQEIPKRTESPLGMKIKLSKTGDASIIQPESSDETNKTLRTIESEHSKSSDTSLGMKIKLSKTGDASIVDPEKKDKQQRRRDTESPLEMKIKLSKTGHPTIVACDNQAEGQYKPKEAITEPSQNSTQRYKEPGQTGHKEPPLKMFKSCHSTILQSNRSELTIEPVQMQGKKPDNVVDISSKRKDITIAPIESKKSKLETQLTQILPEVTIQPVTSREQKQFLFDPKGSAISLQQMNVINQEISITQVRPTKPSDASMSEKLKDILSKNAPTNSTMNSDCEIIEHRPELIIVNENSNSSQDVVIIEEVSPNRMPEVKVPKKRGRPRRNPLPQGITHPPPHMLMPRDSLSLDESQQMQQPQVPHFPQSRENERPKRTCRSQKSYAPPRRGRGRGRGKRKLDNVDPQMAKKPRLEQDLNTIEASTTAVIMIDNSGMQQGAFGKSPELYKALKQPAMDSKIANSSSKIDKKIMGQKNDGIKSTNVANNTVPDSVATQTDMNKIPEMRLPRPVSNDSKDIIKDKKLPEIIPERMQKVTVKTEPDKTTENVKSENKDMLIPPGHPNWLTPMSKRVVESATKHENVSTVQVIDEETRMSAESGSRSQTPARNISAPASETIVNEESQGSVLSTATTESEKVKVKNRRMEINFDPDEGPFTVDKIAEYEWPLDRKGETFMIQEQISQYLGVKSFKRKYPDLKRRVVDMEERNYLRENGLVSEAMCDMGLTAVCSSEVLDVMCSDFPDQYEEYRKHMREKQVKEHSKKQKELTAAANAEKNRIDLAEMAVQSALSWNISLNKARRENRKCSLDLQTFTIHVPKKQQKVETERRIGHYPVALIPGQYTDYYREYTPAELRYYPLNTVLYGPMRPNERKFDSQSEGSQSDSDSDSSSDDSSEGTQDTEGSQSTMDEVDMDIANQKDEIKLKCKMCLKTLNKHSKNEVLIQCGTCNGHVHPSCIDLTLDMVPHIQSYAWQCTDCKTCAQCHDPADEDKMLFCDMCDRGYHIYCVGLRRVPQGRWHCQECAVCANCGSREPGGVNSDRNSVAQWQHEYKKGDKNTRVYVSTLCVPCSKLRGDQGSSIRQEKLSV